MNDDKYAKLRELHEKATKNWVVRHEFNVMSPRPGCSDEISCFNASSNREPEWHDLNATNAQLAVEARNALPALLADLDAATKERDKLERSEEQLCGERDDAEQALSQAYYLVTGESPEWSNHFGHAEAHEAISDAMNTLKQAVADLRTENAKLREALDTIANPRRGRPEEYWDVEQIGNFARTTLGGK